MSAENWSPPSPDDVRALRHRYSLTQAELAGIALVQPRHVQRWEASEKTLTHQPPSRQMWELVLIQLGEKSVDRSLRRRASKARN